MKRNDSNAASSGDGAKMLVKNAQVDLSRYCDQIIILTCTYNITQVELS